ncbi:MAG: glycosyltransferase family 2 protein [Planctomycetaceae bacterium]|nr:glycosyltransferase family 2 protein [Planctomycetaceae bacterium]
MSERIAQPERVPITAVVIAKNEAANLPRCLQALTWCDEVVVVDDHSTDDTIAIAKEFGARVLTHRFETFAAQRNWALDSGDLRHDWVLMLDADEVATSEFGWAIARAVQSAGPDVVGFRTCRKTMLMGQWLKYSDGFPVWIMRIVRRGRARFHDSGHGEVPVPDVDGTMGTICEPFLHYPFSKGLTDWLQRHIRYAEREAAVELQQLQGGAWTDLLSLQSDRRRRGLRSLSRSLPARPLLRFCYQYFFKRGFLDGSAGLTFSRLMACYEAMILAKRKELSVRERGDSI